MIKWFWTAALALSLSSSPASADVVSSDDGGFVVAITADSDAPPMVTWRRMVQPALWWSSDHTVSGDAANMTLDARAGGCWCEAVTDGGSVAHGQLISFEPDFESERGRILMRSELGPLRSMAVNGWLEWRVEPLSSGRSRVYWRYTVRGHGIAGHAELAQAVNAVLTEQVARLTQAAP